MGFDTNEPAYQKVRERAKELRDFYSHLWVYIIINAGLLIVGYLFNGSFWMGLSVMFFWGIGLVWHGVMTFLPIGVWSKAWEDRKIRQLMEREGYKIKRDQPEE